VKIATISTGPTMEDYVITGACDHGYLLIIDADTMEYEVMVNPTEVVNVPDGGKLFAEFLSENNVRMILVGDCAFEVLKEVCVAGIQIFIGIDGTVHNVVEQFKNSYYYAMYC